MFRELRYRLGSRSARVSRQERSIFSFRSTPAMTAVLGALTDRPWISSRSLPSILARMADRRAARRMFLDSFWRKSRGFLAKATPPPRMRLVRMLPAAGVARALLAEELARGAFHLSAALGGRGALPPVGVVGHDRLLQQGDVDPRAEQGLVDLHRVDLAAFGVVDGDFQHHALSLSSRPGPWPWPSCWLGRTRTRRWRRARRPGSAAGCFPCRRRRACGCGWCSGRAPCARPCACPS